MKYPLKWSIKISDTSENSHIEGQQWIKHRAMTPIWLLSVDIFSVKKKKEKGKRKKKRQALQYKSQGRSHEFTCSRYTEVILCGRRNWLLWDISALIADSRGASNRDDGHGETWNNAFELESNPQYPRTRVHRKHKVCSVTKREHSHFQTSGKFSSLPWEN